MVDPDDVVEESNEGNNTFIDRVTVTDCPSQLIVSGQVTTPDGRGLRGATVSITDGDGVKRTVITSSLGFYSFDDIEIAGEYIVAVASKRYRFAPRTVQVTGTHSDINFVGIE